MAAALENRLKKAQVVDGEKVLMTDDRFTNAYPLYGESKALSNQVIKPLLDKGIPIVAGFTGATSEGLTTTLGRGGTDLTASMLARCLGAQECWFSKES